ncbi:MAG: phasin family protein [bacterium]|jgi:polyhydroxyalkanoate synthesis regulator phasin
MSMRDVLAKMLSLGLGIVAVSKEQVEKVVDELVKKGEMAPAEARRMVDEMLERGREEKERLGEVIRNQIRKSLTELDLVSREELLTLQQRVQYLEERLQELEAQRDSQE